MNFQYITQEIPNISHQELVVSACEAGVKWVQLRMKNRPYNECLQVAKESLAITRKYGAKLIINDFLEIALAVGADGVHLGKEDMPVSEAKKAAPAGFIIGGTANTFEDIKKLAEEGANYIGCGPFKFTNTKKKLSPILGLEGYREILRLCRLQKIASPVIAIGGIVPSDIPSLKETGVYGIAVASALTNAADKTQMVRDIYQLLEAASVGTIKSVQ